MKKYNIILFGKMGSGKTTVAKYLEQNCDYERLSFATELKNVAVNMLGRPIDKSIDRKFLQDLGQIVKKPYSEMTAYEQSTFISWLKNDYFQQYYKENIELMHKEEYYAKKLFDSVNYKILQLKVIDDARFLVEEKFAKARKFLTILLDSTVEMCYERLKLRDGNCDIDLFNDVSEIEHLQIIPDYIIDTNKSIQLNLHEIELKIKGIFMKQEHYEIIQNDFNTLFENYD